MRIRLLSTVIPALLLAACSEGVPRVEDPHNIVVDGQKVTQAAFLRQYCAGKSHNETCIKVLQAKQWDSTRGAMPKDW